jgi:hypothetical protein
MKSAGNPSSAETQESLSPTYGATSSGRTNFRQEQIKRQLADIDKQISVMKLSNYASVQQSNEQSKLEELEVLRDELNRKLRTLQLNQIRQRKLRERRKQGVEVSFSTPDGQYVFGNSSGEDLHSECSRYSGSPDVEPLRHQFKDALSGNFVSTTTSTSSNVAHQSQFTTYGVQQAQYVPVQFVMPPAAPSSAPVAPVRALHVQTIQSPQVFHASSTSSSQPISHQQFQRINSMPEFNGVWKNSFLQQVVSMTELEFLDVLQSYVQSPIDLREPALRLLQLRQQFLKDCAQHGRVAAQAFFFLQVECGTNLTDDQKRTLSGHCPV